MVKPKWTSKVSANDFYSSLSYKCPKCKTTMVVELDPMFVLACDVLRDQCPNCNTFIIINMLHKKTSDVIIEGYPTYDQINARTLEIQK